MDFFVWQGKRRPHGEPCNDEQRGQAEKDAIYALLIQRDGLLNSHSFANCMRHARRAPMQARAEPVSTATSGSIIKASLVCGTCGE